MVLSNYSKQLNILIKDTIRDTEGHYWLRGKIPFARKDNPDAKITKICRTGKKGMVYLIDDQGARFRLSELTNDVAKAVMEQLINQQKKVGLPYGVQLTATGVYQTRDGQRVFRADFNGITRTHAVSLEEESAYRDGRKTGPELAMKYFAADIRESAQKMSRSMKI